MYAGLISLMVVGLLASQSGALGFSVYDSLRRSEWSSATWTTSILHFEMRLFLRLVLGAKFGASSVTIDEFCWIKPIGGAHSHASQLGTDPMGWI